MAVQYGSGNYAVCSGVALGSATNRFMNIVGASYIPNNVDAAHGFIMAAVPGMGLYGTRLRSVIFSGARWRSFLNSSGAT